MRTRWPHFSRIGVRVADGKLIYELLGQGRLLIESFNGKPQASLRIRLRLRLAVKRKRLQRSRS